MVGVSRERCTASGGVVWGKKARTPENEKVKQPITRLMTQISSESEAQEHNADMNGKTMMQARR